MNVLIVDDNQINRKLLCVTLEAEGFTSMEAADGLEALAVLDRQPVEAVITDILMPRMDGFRLCHEIRKHRRFDRLPLIIYTGTYKSPTDEKLALDVGGDVYLRKPCPVAAIVAALRKAAANAKTRGHQHPSPPKEVEVMREYSEALVNKLAKELPVAVAQRAQSPAFQTTENLVSFVLRKKRAVAQLNHRALIAKDGRHIPIDDSAAPILDAAGQLIGAVLVFHEVTEKRRAQQALRESEERFRVAQELSLDAFSILTAVRDEREAIVDFRWVYANPEAGRILRHRPEELIGRRLLELLPSNRTESDLFARYVRVVETGQPHDYELRYQCEGIDGWFRNMTVKLGDGVAVSFSDITERKRAEAQLIQTQEELKQHAANLERTVAERTPTLRDTVGELEHFSYTITHDMRAPLRAMQAFGKILREEYYNRLDDMGADYLRRIIEAAGRMDSLITDSLNDAKAAQSELTLEAVDTGCLLRGIVESYPQFQQPGAEIELAENLPHVLANQAGLSQCFSNLLGNAVKFVEPGKMPRVRLWPEERGDLIRLWIEDNGIGIPPEHQERVFVMFQRLTKDYEGTGVGLALVRKVVDKMRGKVGLESQPGKGTRFWLELAKAPAKS